MYGYIDIYILFAFIEFSMALEEKLQILLCNLEFDIGIDEINKEIIFY